MLITSQLSDVFILGISFLNCENWWIWQYNGYKGLEKRESEMELDFVVVSCTMCDSAEPDSQNAIQ